LREAVNDRRIAVFAEEKYRKRLRIARLEVLLDRAGISPGAIDGLANLYLARARAAYFEVTGRKADLHSPEAVEAELAESGGDAFGDYTITEKDLAGPFVAEIPARIQDQTALGRLSYRNVAEELAERFHMDEDFLKFLNPGADFSKAGTMIKVAQTGRDIDRRVGNVIASRRERVVRAYDLEGGLIGIYPASIGSTDNPSPHGTFTVRNKAANPFYTLSRENTFELVSTKRNFRVAPGPNNPVGTAWIGLSKPTYGIHGTPEPSRIGRAESHGCIRLTNWDAMELAKLVGRGVQVVIE
jgi:lipoprotein-anchoring transpeptidase ErfK/SrfK